MKKYLENILKSILDLPDNKREYVIRQLQGLINISDTIQAKSDSFKRQLTGVSPKYFNDNLHKSVEVLKLFGFNEFTFAGLSPEFLEWFIDKTSTNTKYNPKLMNFYLLESMQQAYYITYANNENEQPKYSEVKKTLLTFNEVIEDYKKQSKQSLTELIANINGKD